jgi:hypothetical protein
MKANTIKTYRTSDLQEASFLLLNKCRLVSQEKERGKVFFVFDATPELEKLVLSYINGEALVNPKEFYSCWRDLRARLI